MGTNDIAIKVYKTVEESPVYRLPEYKAATITNAAIVNKGMENGKSTVDLIFVDESGQKYVALITNSLLAAVANIARAEDGMN